MSLKKGLKTEIVVALLCTAVVLGSIAVESVFCSNLFSRSGALLIVIGLYVAWHREYTLGAISETLKNTYDDIERTRDRNEAAAAKQNSSKSRYSQSLKVKSRLNNQYQKIQKITPNSPSVAKLGKLLEKGRKTSEARREKIELADEKIGIAIEMTQKAQAYVDELIKKQENIKKQTHILELSVISIGTIIWAYGSLIINFKSC